MVRGMVARWRDSCLRLRCGLHGLAIVLTALAAQADLCNMSGLRVICSPARLLARQGVRQEFTYLPIGDLGLIVMAFLRRAANRSNRASYSLSRLAPTLRNQ